MGDPSSSFLKENEHSARSTPCRRKVQSKISQSFISPNAVRSPQSMPHGQKAVTIFDQIDDWFKKEISIRSHVASICCAISSMFFFAVTTSLLKLSFWSPLKSTTDAATWALNPINWMIILLHGVLVSATALFTIKKLCKVDQISIIPMTEIVPWLSFFIDFAQKLMSFGLITILSDSEFTDGFSSFAIACGICVSSYLFIFRTDFVLMFPSYQVNSLKTGIEFLKRFDLSMFLKSCGFDAILSYISTMLIVVSIGPFFSGFHAWWLLMDFYFHYTVIVVLLAHHIYAKFFMKIVNQCVMKPMKFPFPPPFSIHSPTPEQTRTMTNIIDTDDRLLKTFAFYDLRTISWTDETRRRDIFSLSQPGGHPRNWKCVSSACTRLLDEFSSRISISAARLVGYSWVDQVEESGPVKDALLMPRKMREMTFGKMNAGYRMGNVPPPSIQNPQENSLKNKILNIGGGCSESLVSRYEAQMISFAAESVYMLVVASLGEDKYGVVNKDLKELVSLLCKVIGSIDNYERARASVAGKSDVTYLRIVDSSLKSCLQRVFVTFGKHVRELNLSEEQMRTVRITCQLEDV